MTLEKYIYARDPDHALELLGHGAVKEYDTASDAVRARMFEDFPPNWSLYKIVVDPISCQWESFGSDDRKCRNSPIAVNELGSLLCGEHI